jgi:hypothetical protein
MKGFKLSADLLILGLGFSLKTGYSNYTLYGFLSFQESAGMAVQLYITVPFDTV